MSDIETILVGLAITLSVLVILEYFFKMRTGRGMVHRVIPDALVDRFSSSKAFRVLTYTIEKKGQNKIEHVQHELLRNVRLPELAIKIREATAAGLGIQIEADVPKERPTD